MFLTSVAQSPEKRIANSEALHANGTITAEKLASLRAAIRAEG